MTTKKVTIIVQIGNSDNKLHQLDWSDFISEVDSILRGISEIHFAGGAAYNSRYQNVCFVVVLRLDYLPVLKNRLSKAADNYNQDSIALTIGETEFITGKEWYNNLTA